MKCTFIDKKETFPETLHQYAEKKISKLDKYFKQDAEAFVTCSIERGRHKAEVTVRSGGMVYRVSETTSDMYASIDSAVAAIERQIHRNKTRLEKKLRQGAFEKGGEPVSYIADEDEDQDELKIVRTKTFSFKPMTPEEAVLQMNLVEHDFFAFKNSENEDRFAIVYRRKSGDYGLINSDES
ncbi:MAG: ribosome-associated translation inhibitor RaiA [Oscillospiraceae bacterium]|nr:ribosome-associated translation inhibitor RaiA [Oscillospiraceae bacterium]